jgi:mannosyltransferase OCH1-like enzyme
MIPYTAEAYAAKKYAFVSDFARFYVLHKYGGLYFDTDVEVIRTMDDIIERGAFMGIEQSLYVAPGLGLGAPACHPFYSWYLSYFSDKHFTPTQPSMVPVVTQQLQKYGWIQENKLQIIQEISIYPSDYFCPQAMMGAPINITNNTRSIHHYDGTWIPIHKRLIVKAKSLIKNILNLK